MSNQERLSIFDIYKIGVGPSSSHTLGPWKAALAFAQKLQGQSPLGLRIHLYGSLSKTGVGHGTDVAVQMGLQGYDPETVATERLNEYLSGIRHQKKLRINEKDLAFDPASDIIFEDYALPYHPNALRFVALMEDGTELQSVFYSTGGGFIVEEGAGDTGAKQSLTLPYPIDTESDLLAHLEASGAATISEIVYANELAFNDEAFILRRAEQIWQAMQACIYRGCHTEGILPGGLGVRRRAHQLHKQLNHGYTEQQPLELWLAGIQNTPQSFISINKWVSCFAIAVNEENAALGRVVTSPTNGAAGVIPAVLMYYYCFGGYQGKGDILRFLLTSGEVGCLFKKGATISAAQGGCQAEIGVSSAMAAAGLTELLGGTPKQALMAAEIAMEHHLGLTCDPVGGLVQVPCIERNAMGAMKAITAAHLALSGDPLGAIVNLDTVIKTMWDTANDMNHKYKETAEGGLALHISVGLANC